MKMTPAQIMQQQQQEIDVYYKNKQAEIRPVLADAAKQLHALVWALSHPYPTPMKGEQA